MTAPAPASFSEIDPAHPRGDLYHILDWPGHRTHGVELETAEFLHALVRATKPDLVLESGTGYGGSTRYLAAALEANCHGRLISYESNGVYFGQATVPDVDFREGSSLDHQGDPPELVFLDSAPLELRGKELSHWVDRPVLLVVHDTRLGLVGRLLPDGGFHLDVPCGLWMRDQR